MRIVQTMAYTFPTLVSTLHEHRLHHVRTSGQWQCDHCKNVRHTANRKVHRYQCQACDFDLCGGCMLTTVTRIDDGHVLNTAIDDGSSSEEEVFSDDGSEDGGSSTNNLPPAKRTRVRSSKIRHTKNQDVPKNTGWKNRLRTSRPSTRTKNGISTK